MKRLVYVLLMLFWVDNFFEGGPLISLILGYYTHRFFNIPKELPAPVLTFVKAEYCNCPSHRLVGRIKMAA